MNNDMTMDANMNMQYMVLSRDDKVSSNILHASIGVTVEYTQGTKVSNLYKQQCTNSK